MEPQACTQRSYASAEQNYRGPRPSIPKFSHRDPGEFARLKMALDNLLPADGSELFKYQILVDHLQLEDAKLMADSYLNSPTPYSDTMAALNGRFGQPHQIALSRIASAMDSPDIRRGDTVAFDRFALQIRSLVGMLQTLGPEGEAELNCGSHVARLLSKLPQGKKADFRRAMFQKPGAIHTLLDFSLWLQYESWCQDVGGQVEFKTKKEGPQKKRATTILHGAKDSSEAKMQSSAVLNNIVEKKGKPTPYCPYCNKSELYLSQCVAIKELTKDQVVDWIRSNRRCWRCARTHQAAQCNLKKPCGLCQGKHLSVLHKVNTRKPKETTKTENCPVSPTTEVLYLDKPSSSDRVLLKVVRVTLTHGERSLDTYAILDDGSERTMLLPAAVRKLGLQGRPEDMALRTIRHDVQTLHVASVSFHVCPAFTNRSYIINEAFTAARRGLADHTYPIDSLQKRYKHLSGLPLQQFVGARPLLLIGADHPHLITPVEPVRLGPPGGPAAVRTRLVGLYRALRG